LTRTMPDSVGVSGLYVFPLTTPGRSPDCIGCLSLACPVFTALVGPASPFWPLAADRTSGRGGKTSCRANRTGRYHQIYASRVAAGFCEAARTARACGLNVPAHGVAPQYVVGLARTHNRQAHVYLEIVDPKLRPNASAPNTSGQRLEQHVSHHPCCRRRPRHP
jgi:hypothetical protein